MKKNSCYILLALFAGVFYGCTNEEPLYKPKYLPVIDASVLPKENRAMTMFEDDEDPSKMYDKKDRSFRVNEPLQIFLKGKDSVQICLYLPVALSNVKIYAKLPNYEKRFLIYHFSKIPAFHRSFHKIPLTEKKHDYLLETGNTVTIDQIQGFMSEAIEFSLECDDPLFKKLKKIKSRHLVQFDDKYHKTYDPIKYHFLPMNPVLAKEAITYIYNYSYALSHPLYYDTFMNFDKYIQERTATASPPYTGPLYWHGNAADKDGVYDYLSKEEAEQLYWKYIDDRIISIAMVGGANGWGGGNLVSVYESSYMRAHWKGDIGLWVHEYSHNIDMGHDSSFAVDGKIGGQSEMMSQFYQYLIYLDDLPFTNPDILQSWTKSTYLRNTYTRPVFQINANNPFLLKYKGAGKWN